MRVDFVGFCGRVCVNLLHIERGGEMANNKPRTKMSDEERKRRVAEKNKRYQAEIRASLDGALPKASRRNDLADAIEVRGNVTIHRCIG